MSEQDQKEIEALYTDAHHWHINAGDETIHAKRMSGRFRTYKWYAASLWLSFFILPYFRIEDHQAILFDIPHRQFHLGSLTIWPQDVWMLSLVLILLAITLFAVTAVAGRVWCGYFCFQTIWTDVFTWLEDKIEGNPIQRRKLEAAAWTVQKLSKKLVKHSLWILISILTGVTFTAYFTDAYQLWIDLVTIQAPLLAWVTIGFFIFFTYVFAGFMREQVCFWLCPYARIQSVMVDKDTELPTYDLARGEPRGKVKRGNDNNQRGDCIDCRLCVGVCPTGVDIREGMQEGCITCGMCIDACDSIMDKVNRPRGLIRYASQKELSGETLPPVFKRPRVITYSFILLLSIAGIIYGLTHIPPVELSVVHERQPLFTQMSNGSIQNRYTIKAVNKTPNKLTFRLHVTGLEGVTIKMPDGDIITLQPEGVIPFHVFLRATPAQLKKKKTKIHFILETMNTTDKIKIKKKSVFIGPKK
ncbi:MAG: cytochrome c oxidase accessory protein CcoG [Mariprofundus sp.]|nr:cytochrome c oxidase accessory protein CcoG [Mariprofundus sp.]